MDCKTLESIPSIVAFKKRLRKKEYRNSTEISIKTAELYTDIIKNISREEVKGFMSNHYNPNKMIISAAGKINHDVAQYWLENYDLRHILERDWDKLGEKLKGKIHIYCGDMDNYYLNNAVYLMEDFLESTTDPYYDGEVDYGDRAEHCWNGDHENPNAISRLRYNSMYVPKIMKRIMESAPADADLTSWRYK